MFSSLNRKIVYSILSLFLISTLAFAFTFYVAYSSKIEKDQLASIQRNQQYADLLYRNANLIREIRLLLEHYPDIDISSDDYKYLKILAYDTAQSNLIVNEQASIAERSRNFDEQYRTISIGIKIIALGAVLLSLFIIFLGWRINRWILVPINKMSQISEEIGRGNFSLRVPLRTDIKHTDELDNLAATLNIMLDNLQNTMHEIRNNEKFLQALIDSIPDGIRVIDQNYRIIAANKNYYRQAGVSPKKFGLCYHDSFKTQYPCDPNHTRCPLHEIITAGKTSVNTIQQFSHHPNRHLAINAAPLFLDNQRRYIIESIRDLSDDIDFSHQQKLSSLGFLSSSIAHEIKNQLGALRMIMEHFIDKYYAAVSDDSDEKKTITLLHDELVKAVDVPERLLKLTRGGNAPDTPIDCAAGINDVLSILDFEAKSKGITITFRPTEENFQITGSETDFRIAVINIILNAIKATPVNGSIDINITPAGKNFQINFADTGCGIAKEDIPYIFNPFFSEGRQKKDGRGSGLGLAITKSIIEKFGGSVSVISAPGKGSCFTLTFPRNSEPPAPKRRKRTKNLPKKNSGIIND